MAANKNSVDFNDGCVSLNNTAAELTNICDKYSVYHTKIVAGQLMSKNSNTEGEKPKQGMYKLTVRDRDNRSEIYSDNILYGKEKREKEDKI